MAKKAIMSADEFLVVSPFLRKSIESSLDVDLTHSQVVPNVLASHFSDLPIVRNSSERCCFINIGSMNENKGQASLIEAFSILEKDYPNIVLVIVGKGELEKSLKEKVGLLGLDGKVEFKGQVSNQDIPELLQSCDALVVASRYETFGVVAIEAMAAGLPVLTTPCGGVESVLIEGAGLIADGYESKHIARSLRLFIEKGVELSAQEIQSHVVDLYGADNVINQLVNIYKKCCRADIR